MVSGRKKRIADPFDRTQRAYLLFESTASNPATLKTYDEALTRFLRFARVLSFDKLVKQKAITTRTQIENYILHLTQRYKKGEIKRSYFSPPISAIDLFLISNDVEVNMKKFKRMIPKDGVKTTGDKPYTNEDILKMSQKADIRAKALLLFYSSTGARGGAVFDYGSYLTFKHIKQYEDGCIGLLIYPDTKYEHPSFLNPEAAQAFIDYKKYRELNGEWIKEDSPLFRNDFEKKKADRTIKPLSKSASDAILRRLAENAGIRVKANSPYERHEKRTTYGFRLRWDTIMKNHEPRLNDNKIERMFSHYSKRMPQDRSYNKPIMDELHTEFDKAIPALTIDPTQRQKLEIQKKDQEIGELKEKEWVIDQLHDKVQTLEEYLFMEMFPDVKPQSKIVPNSGR